MKKMGDLMQELGFRKDAPDSVKKAFIKNLVKEAYGAPVEPIRKPDESPVEFEQLSFVMDAETKTTA